MFTATSGAGTGMADATPTFNQCDLKRITPVNTKIQNSKILIFCITISSVNKFGHH